MMRGMPDTTPSPHEARLREALQQIADALDEPGFSPWFLRQLAIEALSEGAPPAMPPMR